LELAKKKALESSSHLLFPSLDEMIPIFKDKPVYIGWFDTWKHIPKAEPIARGIFEFLSMSKNQYLEPEFEKNKYYHPIYINRASKKEIIQISLNSFSLLLDK
jgi:hypothetical protein